MGFTLRPPNWASDKKITEYEWNRAFPGRLYNPNASDTVRIEDA